MVRRWRRVFEARKGDLSKKRELSTQELEIKLVKKEVAAIKMALEIFSKSNS